jgi:putative intracellular protease/amidase
MAKVLFIVSGATYWVLKDGTRYPTGYWAEEFANPYKILTDAGHEVVVATPNGVTPNVDMMSLRPEMVGGNDEALELEAIIRSAEVMRRPLRLSDVRLEDYDAVYMPGGHGPMSDLAWDADVGRLLTQQPQEKVGVNFSRGPMWKPYMVEDRNLVTGQNPASAAILGNRMLEILK